MKKGKESLTACMAALILQLEKEGRPGTAHVYRSTLRRVLDFTGGVQYAASCARLHRGRSSFFL